MRRSLGARPLVPGLVAHTCAIRSRTRKMAARPFAGSRAYARCAIGNASSSPEGNRDYLSGSRARSVDGDEASNSSLRAGRRRYPGNAAGFWGGSEFEDPGSLEDLLHAYSRRNLIRCPSAAPITPYLAKVCPLPHGPHRAADRRDDHFMVCPCRSCDSRQAGDVSNPGLRVPQRDGLWSRSWWCSRWAAHARILSGALGWANGAARGPLVRSCTRRCATFSAGSPNTMSPREGVRSPAGTCAARLVTRADLSAAPSGKAKPAK